MSLENPLAAAPLVVVSAVGEAEGSRGAAAALACAGADLDTATLLVEVGGRPPRPTLLASADARALEERLAAHLPEARVAARGQVCHLGLPAEPGALETASAAVTVLRGATAVVHVPPALLQEALGRGSDLDGDAGRSRLRPSGVLLRADLGSDRALAALAARDLLARGLAVGVVKRRLSWVAERRALFGALPPGSPGGLPERLVRRLSVGHAR